MIEGVKGDKLTDPCQAVLSVYGGSHKGVGAVGRISKAIASSERIRDVVPCRRSSQCVGARLLAGKRLSRQ